MISISTALRVAFEEGAVASRRAEESPTAPKATHEDLASTGCQGAAASVGFDRDSANTLMEECLYAAAGDTEKDPQKLRSVPGVASIAVGMYYGVLGALRLTAGEHLLVTRDEARVLADVFREIPDEVMTALELTDSDELPGLVRRIRGFANANTPDARPGLEGEKQ